jgi:hypothetical protein
MLNRVLIVIMSLLAVNAFALGRSGDISLEGKAIQVISDGESSRVFVYGANISTSGCTGDTSTPVIKMGSANPLASELYSTILMAKASGKQVELITSGCLSNGSYPVIFSIYVKD